MEPVLNELSIVSSRITTQDRLRTLADAMLALDALGFARILRTTRDALDRSVEDEATLRVALGRLRDRDLRDFLRQRLSRTPYVEELQTMREAALQLMMDGQVDGASCRGAVLAFLTNAPVVSLLGDLTHSATLRVVVSRMSALLADGREPELESEVAEVVHIASPSHVAAVSKLLRDRVLRAIRTGSELWERRATLFPRLQLCPPVEEQLRALSGSELGFAQIVEALGRLNDTLMLWKGGPFEPGLKYSVESASTLGHPSYGVMRDFECVDSMTRRFSLHLKLVAANRRIYYRPFGADTGKPSACVGYVGPHLPTVKYST